MNTAPIETVAGSFRIRDLEVKINNWRNQTVTIGDKVLLNVREIWFALDSGQAPAIWLRRKEIEFYSGRWQGLFNLGDWQIKSPNENRPSVVAAIRLRGVLVPRVTSIMIRIGVDRIPTVEIKAFGFSREMFNP